MRELNTEYLVERLRILHDGDYEYKMRILSYILKAMDAKQYIISLDYVRKVQKLEFSPPVYGPNIIVKNGSIYSIWYNPTFYLPTLNSYTTVNPDFVILQGNHGSLYKEDIETMLKEFYKYEFLSSPQLKEVSQKLLSKMKTPHLVVYARRCFSTSLLKEIKKTLYYIRPKQTALICDFEIDDVLKMQIPWNVQFLETSREEEVVQFLKKFF